jgi:hypothetical protein
MIHFPPYLTLLLEERSHKCIPNVTYVVAFQRLLSN